MLVDDESIILNALHILVPWAELDLSPVLLADSGEQALVYAQENDISILITDIRMPHMDGLELIKRVKARHPHCVCIILSAYDDFEKAKQAIRLGAFCYLSKPINPDELVNVLRDALKRLDSQIDAKKQMDRMHSMKTRLMRERLLLFLNGPVAADSAEFAEQHGDGLAELSFDRCILVYLRILTDCFRQNRYAAIFIDMLEQTLANNGWPMEHFYGLSYLGACICILGQPDAANDPASFYAIVQETLRAFESRFLVSLVGTASDDAHSLMELKRLYQSLSDAVMYRVFVGELGFSPETRRQTAENPPLVFSSDVKKSLLDAICLNKEQAVREIIAQLKQVILSSKVQSKSYFINALLSLLLWELEELAIRGLVFEGSGMEETATYQKLMWFDTLDALLEWIADYCVRLAAAFSAIGDSCKHGLLVEKLKEYVRSHLDEELTLDSLGAAFNYSGSYISRIFKRYENRSIKQYVQEERIALVKQLLRQTEDSLEVIAGKAGFCDSHYFIRIFHAATGTTPNKYRKH